MEEITVEEELVHSYVFEDGELSVQSSNAQEESIYTDSMVFVHDGNYYVSQDPIILQEGDDSSVSQYISSNGTHDVDSIETDMEGLSDETKDVFYEYTNTNSNDSAENVIYELEPDENANDGTAIIENYQYSLIKNCKFVLEETPMVEVISECTETNQVAKIVDISEVVGRNMVTGQAVTLHSYLDKAKVGKKDYSDVLNKTIELGVNTKGKKLFGKILEIQNSVNIQKPIEKIIKEELTFTLPIITNVEYDLVRTTLLGLMDMESIRDKISDKPLYVKLIESVADNVSNVKLVTGCLYLTYDGEGLVFITFNMDREIKVEYQDETLRRELMFKYRYVCPLGLTVTVSTDDVGQQATRVILNQTAKHLHTCILCNKQSNSIKSLHRHYATIHSNFKGTSAELIGPTKTAQPTFKCFTCNRRFKTRSSMKRHQAVHNPELRIYECTICKQRYTDNSGLRKHLVTHTGLKPHVCEICGRAFAIAGDLTSHKRTHLMQGGHMFTCETCGRTFSRQSNMQRHAQIHAQGVFECHICHCTYQHCSSLTRHMIQVHVFASADDADTS